MYAFKMHDCRVSTARRARLMTRLCTQLKLDLNCLNGTPMGRIYGIIHMAQAPPRRASIAAGE